MKPIKNLDDFLDVIEDDKDTTIVFTSKKHQIDALACHKCPKEGWHSVDPCECRDIKTEKPCPICAITEFADVFHLPLVTVYSSRILKARFYPTEIPLTNPTIRCSFCHLKNRLEVYRRIKRWHISDALFHILNWMSLWSVSATLNDLWHAQGLDVVILRATKYPRKTWMRCFDGKKDEWRANGIMATMALTAATALFLTISHDAPRLLCLTSITCTFGSTVASATLLTRFHNENAMRLAWFEGGELFVMALSAPSAWLRWGIVTFMGALLTHLWMTQPLSANIVVSILVAFQFILLGYQSYAFRDASQHLNAARPLRIDYPVGNSESGGGEPPGLCEIGKVMV